MKVLFFQYAGWRQENIGGGQVTKNNWAWETMQILEHMADLDAYVENLF